MQRRAVRRCDERRTTAVRHATLDRAAASCTTRLHATPSCMVSGGFALRAAKLRYCVAIVCDALHGCAATLGCGTTSCVHLRGRALACCTLRGATTRCVAAHTATMRCFTARAVAQHTAKRCQATIGGGALDNCKRWYVAPCRAVVGDCTNGCAMLLDGRLRCVAFGSGASLHVMRRAVKLRNDARRYAKPRGVGDSCAVMSRAS